MAEISFPFENIDTTESQFSSWARNFQETGIQGSPNGTELKVTTPGTGLAVSVAIGQAFIRGHYYINNSAKTLTLTSAGTNTRIDYIVAELDPTANTIVAKIVQGTAVSSNPTAPTLTQTDSGVYQLPIAKITIPNSTINLNSSMITDVRTFMGHRVGIWTTATRPANPIAYQTMGYNQTTNSHEFWNGSAWNNFLAQITTKGDMIVGDSSGLPSRFPIGDVGEYLTNNGSGELAWGAPPGGIYYTIPSNGILNIDVSGWATDTVWACQSGTFVAIYFLDASGAELTNYLSASDHLYITVPAGADTLQIIKNTTSQGPNWFSMIPVTLSLPTSSQEIITLTSTQSVTLTKSYDAYVFGGGGGGGGSTSNANSEAGGGGGGSGYFATGIVTPGTYTATIGARGTGAATVGTTGGSSSISTVVANGGLGGVGVSNDRIGGNGGNGGSGGSGGAAISEGVAAIGGINGSNGVAGLDGGLSYTPGNGGIGSASAISGFLTRLITLGTTGGQLYAGGNGGAVNGGNSTSGATATSYAGGGAGFSGTNGTLTNYNGGNGFQGLIILIERV